MTGSRLEAATHDTSPGPERPSGASAPVSLTGVPTVVGWHHEIGYRSRVPFECRGAAVRTINTDQPAKQATLLRRYDVQDVYAGPAKHARYDTIPVEKWLASSATKTWTPWSSTGSSRMTSVPERSPPVVCRMLLSGPILPLRGVTLILRIYKTPENNGTNVSFILPLEQGYAGRPGISDLPLTGASARLW